MAKQPISAQIAEVKREIALRTSVYPGLIGRGKMRPAEADLHKERMQAVLATLEWLQENETGVVAIARMLKADPELKGKAPIVLFFDTPEAAAEMVASIKERMPHLKTGAI